MDRSTKLVFTFAAVFFAISCTAFIISMSVGWSFVERIDRTHDLMLRAALTTASASSALFGLIWIFARVVYTGAESKFGSCILFSSIILVFFSGFLSVVGGVIFLTASGLTEGPGVVSYGVSAGIFALISGVTCCIGICCCAGGISDRYIDAMAYAWSHTSQSTSETVAINTM